MSWRLILLSIYFIPNIVLPIVYVNNGVLGGDFSGNFISDNIEFISIVAIEILLMIFFLLLIYFVFASVGFFKKIRVSFSGRKDSVIFYFVLCIQIGYLIYTQYYGVAVLSNKENVEVNNPLKYIFTVFNPDALFLCCLILDWKQKRRIATLSIIFLISNFLRGWISGAILQLIILLLTKKFSREYFRIKYLIFFAFFAAAISPSIYFAKYVSRDAEISSLERYSSYYSQENYSLILERVFSRFQHVAETYTLTKKIDELIEADKKREFVPLYLDNSFRRILADKLSYNQQTLNEFSAKNILKRESGGNIHTGILPWLILSEFSLLIYIFYMFIIVFIQYYIFRNLSKDKVIAQNFTIWFSMFYLWHGWFFGFTLLFIPSATILFILTLNFSKRRER